MFKVDELAKAVCGKLRGKLTCLEATGISIDTRTIKPQQAFIAIRGNNFDGHCFLNEAIARGAACLIVKKAPDCRKPDAAAAAFIEVADTTRALGDFARWQRAKSKAAVIAVTGSCGKTTTKDMIAHVLSRRFKVLKNQGTKNNHIGLPLTLSCLDDTYDIAVLELGSNHPGEIDYLAAITRPEIAVITNIGQAHLEAFVDLSGVFKEKVSLLKHLTGARIGVLNADSESLDTKVSGRFKKINCLSYGLKTRSDFSITGLKVKNTRTQFFINKKQLVRLNTPGAFNAYNAACAVTVARLFGMSYAEIAASLGSFVFPAGRLTFKDHGRVKFIDDTYNSNPSSLNHALLALEGVRAKGRKILVMGDMLELGSNKESFHRKAGAEIARICDAFIGVGDLSKKAAQTICQSGFSKQSAFTCDSAQEARDILFKRLDAKPGDVVLVKGSRSMKMEEIFLEEEK